jgi:hypothetical protein
MKIGCNDLFQGTDFVGFSAFCNGSAALGFSTVDEHPHGRYQGRE